MGSPKKSVMQKKLLEVIQSGSSVTLGPATAFHLLQKVRVDVETTVGCNIHHNRFPDSTLMTIATKTSSIELSDAHRRDCTAQLLLRCGDPSMCNNSTHTKLKGLFVMRKSFFLWFTSRFSTA